MLSGYQKTREEEENILASLREEGLLAKPGVRGQVRVKVDGTGGGDSGDSGGGGDIGGNGDGMGGVIGVRDGFGDRDPTDGRGSIKYSGFKRPGFGVTVLCLQTAT